MNGLATFYKLPWEETVQFVRFCQGACLPTIFMFNRKVITLPINVFEISEQPYFHVQLCTDWTDFDVTMGL